MRPRPRVQISDHHVWVQWEALRLDFPDTRPYWSLLFWLFRVDELGSDASPEEDGE